MKTINFDLAIIFYIVLLFVFDFTFLGLITIAAYTMFNILDLIDTIKRRK